MEPWFAIAAPIVVGAFLVWYLWSSRRRRGRGRGTADAADPRDAWDALSHGEDPTDRADPTDRED